MVLRGYFPKISHICKILAIKIMAFISIVIIVLSFSIDLIFPSRIRWSIFVFLGLISMWIGLFSLISGKYHMPRKIVQQVAIVSILAIFWDWKIGWKGWSLDFVIPIACMGAMITIYVIAKIMKLSINDYITYANRWIVWYCTLLFMLLMDNVIYQR